jgi:hypothetical protein
MTDSPKAAQENIGCESDQGCVTAAQGDLSNTSKSLKDTGFFDSKGAS